MATLNDSDNTVNGGTEDKLVEKENGESLGALARTIGNKGEDEELKRKTFRDYLSEDPTRYNVEFSDVLTTVDPVEENADLPDLYRYLRSIQEGDTDLENDREPQSLFNRPENLDKYQSISALKYKVDDEKLDDYVAEFDKHIKDDVLMIANVSIEEIQEEERKLRDAYIAFKKQELEKQKQKKVELAKQEELTKKRIANEIKEKRRQLLMMVELAKQKEKLQSDLLHRAFERSEYQLKTALNKRKAEVKKMYGDLANADGDFGGKKGRRWKLDWDKAPQPIQIKLVTLRGVRDKLPAGRYVMMVSLYNRLGGHVIKWSNLEGQLWGGVTLPMHHEGHFYNSEIKINQSLFTVLPSKPSIRPGMIITFELYILKGSVVNTDRVVAWGCFPICDGTFEIIEGKYKAPMLRGEMDFRLDKHSQIEKIVSSDLDHWLCNTYFEIVKLPRYMGGQKEYEVELQFSSALVNHPDRINIDGEEYKDSENPILGSALTSHSSHVADDSTSDVTSLIATTNKTSSVDHSDADDSEPTNTTHKVRSKQLHRKASALSRHTSDASSGTAIAARKKFHSDGSTDSEASVDEEDIFLLKKGNEEFKPAPGDPGVYFKRHLNNPVDIYTKKLYKVLPKGHDKMKRRQKRRLAYAEELELHTASVKPPFSEKGRIAERGWKRVSYTVRMFLAELGLSEWRSREFWAMLFLFIFTFLMRIFLHYTGQYLFLKALSIPVNSFNFLPYTVRLNYQASLLHVMEEMSVVIIGPLTIFLFFVLSVALCWFGQKFAGMFPDIGSKFILMFGIQAFFDPIFIMIVDMVQQNYNYDAIPTSMPVADFAKMYWFFVRTQGSGVGGVFVTGFLYIFVMFASGAVLYMYFLRLHNNGRMLDIYWRLHSVSEQMFVPYDLEVSLQELEYILNKAEQWRGEEGERRKVAVYEYVWEEEDTEFKAFDDSRELSANKKKKEKTTHIAVHTLHLDGLRELYRHFLALPDGAIVEIFGEMSYVPGLTKDVKKAINLGARKLEHLVDMGSAASLSKAGDARGRTASVNTLPSVLTASKVKIH